MKRAVKLILYSLTGMLLLLSFIIPGFAQTQSRTLRVGYFDYAGFLEKEEDIYYGYGYEYLEEISSYTGWNYVFVQGTWDECLKRLADGEIDLLCTAQYSLDRARLYDYAQYETGTEYAMLLVKEDNDSIFYNDYSSFDGLTIGMMKNSYQNTLLPDYAARHNFTYSAVEYETAREMEAALNQGEIDAFLTGSLQKITGAKAVAKFAPEPFYFITTKGNRKLLQALDTAMEQIQTADIDYNASLYQKYYGDSSSYRLAFTREEHAFIASHPSIRVAYNGYWKPISYVDEKTKDFRGVCADLMEEIAAASGIQFTYIPVESIPEGIRLVNEGSADLVCGFSAKYEPAARKSGIALTAPIFDVPVTLSKLPSTPLKEIRRIAVPKSCFYLAQYAMEQYPGTEVIFYPNVEKCVRAVKNRRVDAAFENIYSLDQYNKYFEFTDIEPLLPARTSFPVCIGVSEDADPVLRPLLNKLISQFDDKRVGEIVINNTIGSAQIKLEVLIARYILPAFIVLILIILFVVLRSQKKIQRYAFVDTLTGHDNEMKFLLSANRLLRSKGSGGYAVANLDIDKFKLINDMHSFETGNRILKSISKILSQEIGPGELFCRQSSDHFLMLLQENSDSKLNSRLSDIIQRLTDIPQQIGEKFHYTISCGVYQMRETDQNLHNAIGWASLARNNAKAQRNDWIAYYDDSMREKAMREQEIVNRMALALSNREFEVYYQPKYSLFDEKVVGAEALVRWNSHEGTTFYPDEFIPVFESNGFIIQLDLYVFEQVCADLKSWLSDGMTVCPVSINLSRVHLSIQDFYAPYLKIMEQYQIPAQIIEMELTESTLFENHTQMVTLIRDLKRLGLTVSMDDFGSGYSSLNLLKDLPIDYLKMDKEFFNTASDSERGKRVIESVIYMAERLGIAVIAEGVETREQVDYLKTIHCNIVQGYYFSRPMPRDQFEKCLEKETSPLL